MKQSIVVTGGAGFLGKFVVEEINSEYSSTRISVLDISKDYKNIPEPKNSNKIEYKYCDITDLKISENFFRDTDIIFHAAGIVSYKKKDIGLMDAVNIQGTKNICRLCERYKIKLVYASSISAVGINRYGLSDETVYPLRSSSMINYYSLSKLESELIVEKYIGKFPMVIANLGALIGANEYFCRIYNSHAKSKILAMVDTYNSFIDIRDAAAAMVFLEKSGKIQERYIVTVHNVKNSLFQMCLLDQLKRNPMKICLNKNHFRLIKRFVAGFEQFFGEGILPYTSEFMKTSDKDKRYSNKKILNLGFKPKYSLKQTVAYLARECKKNENQK
ncbi:MAG: NAD-dependent epimerase/dehydratase family protein [Nanoarchaeota archaeon]|nr:NAD-dependent epimerase/dehydratase family protein [Nanoarchaeota archaeon]